MIDAEKLAEAARALDRLRFDPLAKRTYELFSGGFVWSDEWTDETGTAFSRCGEAYLMRFILGYRASLIRAAPDPRCEPAWIWVVVAAPNWPGLRPERRSEALRAELERADAALERELKEIESKGGFWA